MCPLLSQRSRTMWPPHRWGIVYLSTHITPDSCVLCSHGGVKLCHPFTSAALYIIHWLMWQVLWPGFFVSPNPLTSFPASNILGIDVFHWIFLYRISGFFRAHPFSAMFPRISKSWKMHLRKFDTVSCNQVDLGSYYDLVKY